MIINVRTSSCEVYDTRILVGFLMKLEFSGRILEESSNILRELDYIVSISFGYTPHCVCLVCTVVVLYCFVMCVRVCFVMCGRFGNMYTVL